MSKLKYRCPQCGKKVVFSEHICPAAMSGDPGRENSQTNNGLFKKLGTIVIVAFLAGAMLWPFLNWQATLVVGFIILAGVGLVLILGSRGRDSAGPLYRQLIKFTGGDKAVAERLINAELDRYPDFNRTECIRRVHDRLEYEHRR